jgi:hypothetical protein
VAKLYIIFGHNSRFIREFQAFLFRAKIEILNSTPVRRKVEFTLTTAHVEFSHSTTDLMFYKTGAARKSVHGYTTQA